MGEEDPAQGALLPDVQCEGDRPRVQEKPLVDQKRRAVVPGYLGARGAQNLDDHRETPPCPRLHL